MDLKYHITVTRKGSVFINGVSYVAPGMTEGAPVEDKDIDSIFESVHEVFKDEYSKNPQARLILRMDDQRESDVLVAERIFRAGEKPTYDLMLRQEPGPRLLEPRPLNLEQKERLSRNMSKAATAQREPQPVERPQPATPTPKEVGRPVEPKKSNKATAAAAKKSQSPRPAAQPKKQGSQKAIRKPQVQPTVKLSPEDPLQAALDRHGWMIDDSPNYRYHPPAPHTHHQSEIKKRSLIRRIAAGLFALLVLLGALSALTYYNNSRTYNAVCVDQRTETVQSSSGNRCDDDQDRNFRWLYLPAEVQIPSDGSSVDASLGSYANPDGNNVIINKIH